MIFASIFLCPSFSWVKMSLMIYKASLGWTDAPGSCCGSGLPSQPSTVSPPAGPSPAAGWKDGRTKSRIGMFLLLILLGQQEHWRSIWPRAVLQPDHRHKLTTCVLLHKPDELPWLGDTLRFPQQGSYWKKDKWEMQLGSNVDLYSRSLSWIERKHLALGNLSRNPYCSWKIFNLLSHLGTWFQLIVHIVIMRHQYRRSEHTQCIYGAKRSLLLS